MKISKLLNRKFSIIFILFLTFSSTAEEQPVDIWNIEKKEPNQNSTINNSSTDKIDNNTIIKETDIYKMQSNNQIDSINLEQTSTAEKIKIFGLYDPDDNSLDMNIWSNSNGDQLKNIFSKISKMNLSEDASEIMKVSILTNAYYPKKDISEKEFLKFKSDWLIKNADLDLIEEYFSKNQIINVHPELVKFLVDEYLSNSNIDKSCQILSKNLEPINNDYLFKFNLYCLIVTGKREQAQIIFDLKKEMGFQDKYFEKKINLLLGYETKSDEEISDKNILDFHLAHKTNPNFVFTPNNSTSKLIWKYLTSSNLLSSFKEIDLSDLDKISTIELAVHDKNYSEKDLLELYKRFQFDINQLLNAKDIYKSLSNIEARALIYQKILLESEMIEKLKLLKILKNSFEKDDIGNAFDIELKSFLQEMDPLNIPDNLTSFYYTNIQIKKPEEKKIKFNNDVLHQSKLINYFYEEYTKSKIEKDINNFLKKISKNKKYFLSKYDIIFLESLKSDGINIDKKYDNLYEINNSEIPTDIQVMINNDEKGAALLRIVEVIGQDNLERIDEDTIYFIISTLNQLNIDIIRNKILLKVLPLKV